MPCSLAFHWMRSGCQGARAAGGRQRRVRRGLTVRVRGWPRWLGREGR